MQQKMYVFPFQKNKGKAEKREKKTTKKKERKSLKRRRKTNLVSK
jgi:hypothetical protein